MRREWRLHSIARDGTLTPGVAEKHLGKVAGHEAIQERDLAYPFCLAHTLEDLAIEGAWNNKRTSGCLLRPTVRLSGVAAASLLRQVACDPQL